MVLQVYGSGARLKHFFVPAHTKHIHEKNIVAEDTRHTTNTSTLECTHTSVYTGYELSDSFSQLPKGIFVSFVYKILCHTNTEINTFTIKNNIHVPVIFWLELVIFYTSS